MKLSPPYKVMVVEDEEIVRAGLELIVQSWQDYKVVGEARDGREAIEKVDLIKPDIVLMDVGMPVLDGIQATRIIRESNPDVKVTMMTSYTDLDTVFASLASGAHGYCIKGSSELKLKYGMNCTVHGDLWVDSRLAEHLLTYVLSLKDNQEQEEKDYPARVSGDEANQKQKDHALLTDRELDVLNLIVEGHSNNEIGDALNISTNTVKTHIKHIFEKLSATDRTQAAVNAIKRGML